MSILIYRAEGFGARLVGWHRFPYSDQVLFIERCKAVHSFGMQRCLTVRFIDQNNEPLGPWRNMPPNRVLMCFEAYGVLEIAWCDPEKRHQVWVAFQMAQRSHQVKRWRWPDFGQKRCDKSDKSSYTNRPS